MIRVLNILETIGSGGVERRRLSLAKYLDKSKFDLKIICTKTEGNIANEIRKNGVEVIEIGKLKSFADIKQHKKVIKIINDFKPHIIHGAVFEGVTMAAINGFFKRVPIVILEETSDPQNRSWKGNLLMSFFSKMSHQLVGVSPAATDYLENKLKINKNKVKLILNGIADPRKVSDDEVIKLKEELNINSDEIVIGSIGRMNSDSHKRFSDLINAFSILNANNDKTKLVLVGEGEERINYEELVKKKGIQDKVIFAGYQEDVALYYSLFDVFSLVSAYEAFGLVLVEAMLHKLPIVATKVGGMQFIVDENETGFLVEKFNVEQIASSLSKLCDNDQLRKEFGEKGYLKAIENYTEKRYVMDVEKLYLELIKKYSI